MKKIILSLLFMAISFDSHAFINFNNARYLGLGYFDINNSDSSEYQVYLEFKNNQLKGDYVADDEYYNLNLDFRFYNSDWFDVEYNGQYVGLGFCLKYHCYYEMEINKVKYSETMTFVNEFLYRMGYKIIDNNIIKWEEKLRKIS